MATARGLFTNYSQSLGRFQVLTTDGTAAGTLVLPGVSTTSYDSIGDVVAGSEVFFPNTSTGTVLVSDGTAAGTVPFTVPGASGQAGVPIAVIDRRALFLISNNGTSQLWTTDGTPADTLPLLPATTGTQVVEPLSGTLAIVEQTQAGLKFPQANTGAYTQSYVVDVTGAGAATLLGTVQPGPVTKLGNTGRFVFSAPTDIPGPDGYPDYEPWVTDGTAAGTYQIAELAPATNAGTDTLGADPTNFTQVAGNQAVFLAAASTTQLGLYSTDGNTVTTLLTGFEDGEESLITLGNGRAVVAAEGYTSNASGPLRAYGTDGTMAGTVALLPDVDVGRPLGAMTPDVLAFGTGGLLIGRVDGMANIGLWLTDGTAAGTTLLSGLGSVTVTAPGYAPTFLSSVLLGGRMFFTVTDGTDTGVQLWVTDGTASGTLRLGDYTGTGLLGAVNGRVVFSGQGVSAGLYTTDGTMAGTQQIAAGLSQYSPATQAANGDLLFTAVAGTSINSTSSVLGLYATDGTAAGTSLMETLGSTAPVNIAGEPVPATSSVGFLALTPTTLTAAAGTLTQLGTGLAVVNGQGGATVQGGTGQSTIFAGSSSPYGGTGAVVFGGTGGLTFINGVGSSTVAGGAGGLTAYTGLGGGAYFGSPFGGNTLVAQRSATVLAAAGGDQVDLNGSGNLVALGSGAETVDTDKGAGGSDTIFGGTGADVIVGGPQGGNVIIAGSGPETIFGRSNTLVSPSRTGSTIFLGSGADVVAAGPESTFIQAGSGSSTVFAGGANGTAFGDVFAFVDGGAGGAELIGGFRVGTDVLALRGYTGSGTMAGITNSQVTGGSTVLTLADNTRITLQGVTNLGTSSFV